MKAEEPTVARVGAKAQVDLSGTLVTVVLSVLLMVVKLTDVSLIITF